MEYISTRATENKKGVSAAMAIKNGLADDGGLYMPAELPKLTTDELQKLIPLSYSERAAYILSKFLTDYTNEELLCDCSNAYGKANFPDGAAPVKKLADNKFVLELYHGPTSAFKDMALQIMPKLLSGALKKTNEDKLAFILVATSGDTGKAALEGYKDAEQVKIMVFYPQNGVSKIQKLQMATQEGENVSVCAIEGNFDDAQNGVKKIFSDNDIKKKLNDNGVILSSANSINWGRLAPQVVYYISAYLDLVKSNDIGLGDTLNVTVPTGNFGNIFAAYIAKMAGLPLGKLVCASNTNNILTDFLATGTYDRNRKFFTTMSPSMDILISSNLERLLYLICGADKTAKYMKSLSADGKYQLDENEKQKIDAHLTGLFADEKMTSDEIRKTFEDYGYLIDTHTAVAMHCAEEYMKKDDTKMLVVSTASPYKFASSVLTSLGGETDGDEFDSLTALTEKTKMPIPKNLSGLKKREVRFKKVINPCDMANEVFEVLGCKN